jgi:hypothetical protein
MTNCSKCKDQLWVCENHPDRPWIGDGCCLCGGAGMPCPACNQTDKGEFPALPEGFVPDVIKKPGKP